MRHSPVKGENVVFVQKHIHEPLEMLAESCIKDENFLYKLLSKSEMQSHIRKRALKVALVLKFSTCY